MKQLVIAEPAARDLEGIVDYIALDNPVAAERVYGEHRKVWGNSPKCFVSPESKASIVFVT